MAREDKYPRPRAKDRVDPLSPLESRVMQLVWDAAELTAAEVRERLGDSHPLADSTVRTVLRRLESKGVVERGPGPEGTFVYRSAKSADRFAANAAERIVQRYCSGSLERLLVGLVDTEVVSADELRRIAEVIAARESS